MPSNPAASRPAVRAAVSMLVAEVVQGPPLDASVLATHRFGLYLSVRGGVLPVVTSDAVALPTAVRLVVSGASVDWGVGTGDVVRVGGGRVMLPGLDVVAARTWRPARVRPRRQVCSGVGCSNGRQGSHLSTQLELDRATSNATGVASEWLADGIRAALSAVGCSNGRQGSHLSTQPKVAAAVAGLVGRGAGLTPSGDDALAGALLVAHALGTGDALADAVRARRGATTAVSAALLSAAAEGYAARPVVTLVDAAVTGDADAVRHALPAVLAIGHTSGADLVTGIRAALEALAIGDAHSTPTGRSAA